MKISGEVQGENFHGRQNHLPTYHSGKSGVEKSTTLEQKSQQDKICNSGRFLGSLRSLGMTCRWVVPFCLHGLYSERGMAMNHRRYIAWFHSTARVIFETLPAPRRGWMALGQRRYIVPCIGRYHSTPQVVIATWRAADCRPYDNVQCF